MTDQNIQIAKKLLDEERVEKEILDVLHDGFDEAMVDGWGELWQRENVNEWIEDPSQIQKIQPSLHDFADMLRLDGGSLSVLDAGCYGGYVYDYLQRYVSSGLEQIEYTGIDSQASVIEAACAVHGHAANATFQVGDIYHLVDTFGENAFDYTFCSRVLVQIPYFEKALEQLFTVTKKAVFNVIAVDSAAKLEKIRRTNIDTGKAETVYFRYFTFKELNAASDAVGARDFRVIQGPRPYASYVISH
jgi:SAM-dependent methyltransferase